MVKKLLMSGVLIAMGLGVFAGCTNDKSRFARENIKVLAEVEIPTETVLLYHYYEGDGLFFPVPGRRAQYTVFEFEHEPIEFLAEYDFQSGRNAENENSFSSDIESWANEYDDVPIDYRMNWENEYLWLTTKRIFFVYYPSQLMLVIYIAGS